MKLLILNGPNLNLIEKRDSSSYGLLSLNIISQKLMDEFPEIEFTFVQSNSETELINRIQDAYRYDGVIINPGGYTHSSIGLRDAFETLKIPIIEVHLSNLASREDFRNILITTSKATGYISGLKEISYSAAVYSILRMIDIQ